MRGDDKVIEQLNAALSAELTAIAQYMVQAEMCESWGYHRLAGITKTRAIREMHHAEGLIARIIFLDGVPAINVPLTPKVGSTVEQQLEFDYDDEADAVRQYNAAAKICREAGDAGTKDFLEAQLHSIKEMGIGAYLSQQLVDAK